MTEQLGARRAHVAQSLRRGLLAIALLVGCGTEQTLRVATSGDYPPFTTEAPDGTRSGLDVAIAMRLSTDLGMLLEWVPLSWPELAAATVRGDFDVALSGITMTADRAVIGRYTRPYASTRAVAVIRPADARRWKTVSDLNRPGVQIVVNAGGHLETVARKTFPRAKVTTVPNNRLVVAFTDRAVDAVVTDSAELSAWPDPNTPIALPPLTVDDKAPLLPADHAELAAQIDDWLMAREEDGWLDAERVRALGPSAALDAAGAARQAVAALVRLRLSLMPDVAAAKRADNKPIADPEQEKRVLEKAREAVPSAPDRAVAVYTQLIGMAKAAQNKPTPSGGATGRRSATLDRSDRSLRSTAVRIRISSRKGTTPCKWRLTRSPSISTDATTCFIRSRAMPAGT